MIQNLTSIVKHAFGLHRPGRRLPVRPDDILLASYPDSGGEVMRWLLANLMRPQDEVSSATLRSLVPDPDVSTKRDFDRAPRPRILSTHSSFDPRYRRVIYVVRDPRDVAASQYQRLCIDQERRGVIQVEDFIEQFLAAGYATSGTSAANYGTWGENVGSWLATRSGYPGFLLVRYEDMVADTAQELARVAGFAGLPAQPEKISRAIERSASALLQTNSLPAAQTARIESAWSAIMACAGYELLTRDARTAIDSSLIGLLAAGVAQ